MARKNLLPFLTLAIFMFFQLSGVCFSDANDTEFKQQRNLVLTHINNGNFAEAQTAMNSLIADFSSHRLLPKSLYSIGMRYEIARRSTEAKKVYEKIIELYPSNSYAQKAQFDIPRMNIFNLLESGKIDEAETAIDELISDFSGYSDLPKVLSDIAKLFADSKRYDQVKCVHQKIVEHYADTDCVSTQMIFVLLCIDENDISGSQDALDKFIADFSKDPCLPQCLYNIARRYEITGNFRQAKQIYQEIAQDYTNSSYAESARVDMDIAKMDIMRSIADGNDANVPAEIDKFIADFNDKGLGLAYSVYNMAVVYYERAQKSPSDRFFAEDNFTKAAEIWDKIITKLDRFDDDIIARAYHFSGYCHSRIEDYPTTLLYYHYVLNNWPNYKYAWNVQCLIGDCYEGLVRTGILTQLEAEPEMEYAYKTTLEKYPGCGFEAHAAFKLGWLYYNWGLNRQAGVYFSRYIEATIPEDSRIELVQKKLAEIAGSQ